MTFPLNKPSFMDEMRPLVWARVLLVGYALALPFRGTASLQAALLLLAFASLILGRCQKLDLQWAEARWVLGPLLIFSIWLVLICGGWREPPLIVYWNDAAGRLSAPVNWEMRQPWFSLNQWRRDVGQPMLALLCGFWAFRNVTAKRLLFGAQGLLIVVLTAQCLYQFHVGEWMISEGVSRLFKGTLQVRGFSHDNIFFSYVLLLLTPGALWLVLERKPGWRGWVSIGILLLLFYLIFLNKRRGAWLAVWVELLLLAGWMGRRRLAVFLLGSLLLGLAAYGLRPQWFQRDYDTTAKGRVEIARNLPELLVEHPWVGVGFGKDTVVKNYWQRIYQHAHNTFVNLALGVGFPGLLIWLAALGAYGWRFWRACDGGWGPRIGLALLGAFCVRNLTDDVWIASNAELFWFLIGVFMPGWKMEPRTLPHP